MQTRRLGLRERCVRIAHMEEFEGRARPPDCTLEQPKLALRQRGQNVSRHRSDQRMGVERSTPDRAKRRASVSRLSAHQSFKVGGAFGQRTPSPQCSARSIPTPAFTLSCIAWIKSSTTAFVCSHDRLVAPTNRSTTASLFRRPRSANTLVRRANLLTKPDFPQWQRLANALERLAADCSATGGIVLDAWANLWCAGNGPRNRWLRAELAVVILRSGGHDGEGNLERRYGR